MKKKALITGIGGQDGSFLSEQLLERDYEVYGLMRRASSDNTFRLRYIMDRIELITGDVTDQGSLDRAVALVKPNEIYNLAAQSYVHASWASPEFTMDVNALGLLRVLEAVRNFGDRETRIYQASSSEQFGKVLETPQKETTRFYPRSIYGVSKVAAHWVAINYRESYKMFVSTGICFNHESHRRGLEFVSRKIAFNVAKIHLRTADYIELGNLDAKRDFGYAPEYTEAMWRILQLPEPTCLVMGTGEMHSIRDFVKAAFECVEIYNWRDYVRINDKFKRPAEVDLLVADSTLARQMIDWYPKTSFEELVRIMVSSDIERLQRGDRFA